MADQALDFSDVSVMQQKLRHRHANKYQWLFVAVAVLLLSAIAAVSIGNYPVSVIQLSQSMWHDELSKEMSMQWFIFSELRLPRVVLAALVGMQLAMAGCVMQGLIRNPLADPGLIGISSGAAAAAAFAMAIFPPLIPQIAPYWVMICAFIGALVAVWLVLKFSATSAGIAIATLILTGVAIQAIAQTVIGAISYVASDDALRQISYWNMGSLAAADWSKVTVLGVVGLITGYGFMRCREALNILALGEKEAAFLGLNVNRYKNILLWLVALSVAVATAFCGIIAFVGLVVPHMCRSIIGVDHKYLLPLSAISGALLLVLADTLSRTMFSPQEVPIGIVTSAIGAPFFLYLLWQNKEQLTHGNK